jgi:predicted RNase H-like nuclease (RuvC/YqgF family)
MTANELPANQLADLLDEIPVGDFESLDNHHFTRQASTMLRQQAKKIENLLEHNVKLIDDLFSERKEVIRLEAEIEALKKELALQKLSDIGQEIEDRESAIYATGYWNGIAKGKEND